MPRWTGRVVVRTKPWQRVFYRFVRLIVGGSSVLYWRVRVEGMENIPKQGPFILSPVHRSYIDTPLMAVIANRYIRFMGKDGMWKTPVSDWFFTTMGGFPVHRGTPDRAALSACEVLLKDGQPLMIFPEGTRKKGPVIKEMFEGPAYLAAKCQVPVVPVGLGGTERAMARGTWVLRPSKVAIVVGAPVPPPAPTGGGRVSRKGVKVYSETLRCRLQELFDDAQRRAGIPESQIGLAAVPAAPELPAGEAHGVES